MQETLTVEQQSDELPVRRKGHTFSLHTILLTLAAFLCVIVATFLTTYNFVTCPQRNQTHDVCERPIVVVREHYADENNMAIFARNASQHEYSHRLPRSLVPKSYDIKLMPFINSAQNFTYSGNVRIIIKCTGKTSNITLHSLELSIDEKDVTVHWLKSPYDKKVSLEIAEQYIDLLRQFYVIKMVKELQAGETYEVRIKYRGVLSEHMVGFYRSSYKIGKETRWVAATQFQPTDARRAFPCFDEPALKAKFRVAIARTKNMTTLSNMPKVGLEAPAAEHPSYVWDSYEETMPMSTYLVCFTITDFSSLSNGSFSVWARNDAIGSAKLALDLGPQLLRFFEEFFELPYPLMKMDMIAIPDFQAGAMENWGLITFRESGMLYEHGISPNINQLHVAIVIAHEISHQWFGNLVTPSWWSDLWLNEGFASYMEYFGVDGIKPQWKSMDLFVVYELQAVLILDALTSSHQIFVHVIYPDEINEIFDRISYAKGASIIRMMDHFLTRRVFKRGLNSYLKKSAYQAAEQGVLWDHLTEAARIEGVFDNETSVADIMNTWILQSGFPVVTVVRNYAEQTMTLTQKKFEYENAMINRNTSPDANESSWFIPITYTTQKNIDFTETKPTHWMQNSKFIEVNGIDAGSLDWVIVNIQQTGYFRVNYDPTNWDLISKYLLNPVLYKKIAPSNRAQLIDDALNLARSGYIDYITAMNVTQYLAHENDYVPWKAAINTLYFIDNLMMSEAEYYKFKAYFLHLIGNVYNEIGFMEPHDSEIIDSYKRNDLLTVACHLGHVDCIQRSTHLFQMWMMEANPDIINPVTPNLRPVVYCTAIKHGDQSEWDFAWNRYKNTTVSSEEEILLNALGCTRETWLLARYLEMSLDETTGIRKQDIFRVFAAISDNMVGHPMIFNFIRNNYNRLKEYLGTSMSTLNSLIKSCVRITKVDELEQFKKFMVENELQRVRTIYQAMENGELNVAWMRKNYQILVDWLGNVLVRL